MPIPAVCPGCAAKLRFSENAVGRKVRCPKCGTAVVVPSLWQPTSDSFCQKPRPRRPEPIPEPDSSCADEDSERDAESDDGAGEGRGPRLANAVMVGGVVLLLVGVGVFMWVIGARFSRPHRQPIKTLTTEEVVAKSEASVALIKGKGSSGTGFLIRPGVLATNAHVLEQEFVDSLQIYFPSAKGAEKEAKGARLVYYNNKRDLAFLAVDCSLPPIELAPAHEFRRGQEITVIGNPGFAGKTLENAISRGLLSTKTDLQGQPYYQLSVAVNPGNSGGPVFDSSGKVIGVVTLKASTKEAIAFCIPLEQLRAAAKVVESQSPKEGAEFGSRHSLETAFRLVNEAAKLYGSGLDVKTNAMRTALDAGLKADQGLALIGDDFQKKVDSFNSILISEVKPRISAIASDPLLDKSLREQMVEMWATYSEMKSYFDDPRGNFMSFSAKTRELKDKHSVQAEKLRVFLGID